MESTLSLESLSLEGLSYDPVSLMDEAIAIAVKYGGSLWIPSLTTNYINSDGTGAAAIDSPVGYVENLNPNITDFPMIQATSASKPMLRNIDGRLAWVLDGIDDYFYNLDRLIPENMTLSGVVVHTADGAPSPDSGILAHRSPATIHGMAVYRANTSIHQAIIANPTGSAWTYVSTPAPTPLNTKYVVSSRVSNTQAAIRRDGVQISSQARAGGLQSVLGLVVIGAVNTGRLSTGAFYGAFYSPSAVPDDELLIVEKYLGSLAGVGV